MGNVLAPRTHHRAKRVTERRDLTRKIMESYDVSRTGKLSRTEVKAMATDMMKKHAPEMADLTEQDVDAIMCCGGSYLHPEMHVEDLPVALAVVNIIAKERKELANLFDRFDVDRSGELPAQQLAPLLTAVCGGVTPSARDIDFVLQLCEPRGIADPIKKDQLQAAIACWYCLCGTSHTSSIFQQEVVRESAVSAFREWDVSGDGFIDKVELANLFVRLGLSRIRADALFRVVDANSDGRIDYQEFVNWLFTSDAPSLIREAALKQSVPARTPSGTTARPPGHPEASLVCPNVLLGGTFDAQDRRIFHEYSITHVLNISREKYKLPGSCQSLQIDIDDDVGEDILQHFRPAADFIERAVSSKTEVAAAGAPANTVLVHCEYGVSRSAAAVVAYIMRSERLDAVQALRGLRKKRPVCMLCPNRRFLQALISWGGSLGLPPVMLPSLLRVCEESFDGGAIDLEAWLEVPAGEEGDRTKDWSDDVRLHRNHIIEVILTLHCPACGQAFLDFTNCFALWCSRCDTAFCAYCQANCRSHFNDAHYHVSRCRYNIAPRKSIFADFKVFELAQNLRRARDIKAYVANNIEDADLRSLVLRSLKRDCEDLGIKVKEVKSIEEIDFRKLE